MSRYQEVMERGWMEMRVEGRVIRGMMVGKTAAARVISSLKTGRDKENGNSEGGKKQSDVEVG